MDERVKGIYSKFIKNRKYDRALEVLDASYSDDMAGTYPLLQNYRMGLTKLIRAKSEEKELMECLRYGYFMSARDYFDDFLIAMEWEREPSQRFYLPRRKQLLGVAKDMQALHEGKLRVLGVSLPPGVGKSTICEFFLDFTVGNAPLDGCLTFSHNSNFLRGMYEEILRHMDPVGEYCWSEIFSERKIVRTNALDLKIDIDKAQRFSSLQFRTLGGQNAGLARAHGLMYVDDPVEGIEEALSEERLDAKWSKLSVDVLQRGGNSNVPLLVVGTRWSVRDPLGRLERYYGDDPAAKFIVRPALNEHDESNFDFGGSIGFTTGYYHQLREIMDEASFRALYQGEPVERSGILYPTDELQRFWDLPLEEPDAVWAVCDTKNKGDDYFCMPIAYQYNDKFYITKIVCDNKTPEVVEPRLVDALMAQGVKMARFESNSAGGRIAENVQNKVKERGGITKITTKYSTANKETRIIVDSAFVKEHFLFLAPEKYDSEYRLAMNMLASYTMSGKNRHDDVPDAMSMLADFVQSKVSNVVQVVKRPF